MRIEPALVDAVVLQVRANAMRMSAAGGVGVVKASEKVSEEDELIETALLQLVMTRLWNDATVTPTERVMETKALDKLGGARNVVKLHLYDRLKELPPAGQAIAAELFQHLVTPSGAKIAHSTEDLIAFAGQPASSVVPVLEHLAKARLLRRVDPPERYEIFHDALAAAILDWRTEYMREAARQAALAEANKRRHRRRLLVAVTMVVVAVVGVALGIAYYERRNAKEIELLAEGLQLQAKGLQLQAQSNEAQATAAKQLQIASDRAREVAENAAKEAELRLEQGRLQLDAERAGLERQSARQADFLAKAKSKDDEIGKVVQAKTAAAKEQEAALYQASQAQQQVNAIAIEQKRDLDLSKIGYDKVAAPAVTQAAPATTLPDASKMADAKPPAYGNAAGAGGGAAGSPPVAQGDYKALYRQAINQRDRKQWSAAERLFESAAAIKPDSGETITMPGAGADQPYLPYYYLGLVRQNQSNCAGALDAWRRAEAAGAVLKSRESQAFRNHRAECAGGK
jgi:L-amino acid N-acyltransferase YncA